MAGCLQCITTNVVWWLNLVFLVAGLGVIGCGVYVFVKPMADWAGKELAYGMFALGVFIVILSMFALCGARRKVQKCAMWVYTIFLTLLLLAQVAVVVIAFTRENLSKDFLQDRWNDLDQSQRDEIMEQAECGIHNDSDSWEGGDSCVDNDCFEDCYNVFKEEFQNVGSVVAIVSIAIVGVEIILLLSSCCLLCSEDEDDDDEYKGNDFSV